MDELTTKLIDNLLTKNEVEALLLAFVRARGEKPTREEVDRLIHRAQMVMIERLGLSMAFQGALNVDLGENGEILFSPNPEMHVTKMSIRVTDEARPNHARS
jgi:hypothetical protein